MERISQWTWFIWRSFPISLTETIWKPSGWALQKGTCTWLRLMWMGQVEWLWRHARGGEAVHGISVLHLQDVEPWVGFNGILRQIWVGSIPVDFPKTRLSQIRLQKTPSISSGLQNEQSEGYRPSICPQTITT